MSAEPPIWTPSLFRIADANLTRFMTFAAARGAEAADYDALYRWSIGQPAANLVQGLAVNQRRTGLRSADG